ncbi:alpha/beta hydrolase [Serinicoccus kebangsaanensis]|uniref:alpha/beta hydrolase n=1 Tax=Serinicoccus kebangsaanensis TaxID=2602069 RepID=UPI00124E2760|nr:alpha/beta-hydrolase family protein [Serinicoccus kebangsaanensis]
MDAAPTVLLYPRTVRPGREWLFGRVSQLGFTLGLVMLWVALSPSLLPRTWWMTTVGVGFSIAYGYLVGSLLGRVSGLLARLIGLQVRVSPRAERVLTVAWDVLLVGVSGVVWWWSVRQQASNADLVGLDTGGNAGMAVGVAGGLGLGVLLVLGVRLVGSLWKQLARLGRRWLPGVVASTVAAVLLLVGIVWVSEGLVYRQAVNAALGSAARLNAETPQGRVAPSQAERSGSPQSTQAWADLGRDGQAMVADGPRAADIARVTGAQAREPIRLYAGKQDNDTIEAAVAAVMREIDRTAALDRSVVHVITSTGTGYVQEWSVASLEYLTGGDVATVSMQYSFFSSALAYATDRDSPPEAGRALFEAVEARVEALPEGRRPRVVVSGESLGSYGGQGAFSSAQDMLDRVDGALWSGTPSFTPVWSELTAGRQPGSPQIAPVVDNGRHVRFVTRPAELGQDFYGGPYVAWEEPRVVYAQHASDPIVWWDPTLLWHEPDWMRERAGRDVPAALTWQPWVSFWQIGMDMPLSVSTPGGHGHHYFREMVPYWAAVLGQDDLPASYLEAVADAVAAGVRER